MKRLDVPWMPGGFGVGIGCWLECRTCLESLDDVSSEWLL